MALTDNLVSYWKLDEASGNAIDAHGSNDLTDNNTVGTGTGIISSARDFERDNSESLTHTDNVDLSPGDADFTFTAWCNLESKVGVNTILGKDQGASSGEFYLVWRSGVDRFQFQVYGTSGYGSGTSINADTLGSPSTGVWYFVVAWHDATANTINIQINDGTVDSVSHSAGVYDSTGVFGIGVAYSGEFFDGLIDEVGYWKRVLTSDERTQLYNGGAGLAYPFAAGGTSPPEVPYRLRGGGIAEIAWPVWGQSFRF